MPTISVDWLLTHSLKAAVILIAAAIIVRAARVVIARLERRLRHGQSDRDLEWQRRASTISGILTRLVAVTVWFLAALMLLREMSIDVLPILTGAGIAGLAIGFGAQNLVRDVISGFFMILEDQVRVGDMARINGVNGVIEQVNLRTIVLRDGEGAVHVFPNGTVTALANLSKQYSNAIVDLRVGYSENLERVFAVIGEAGRSMQEDREWAPLLLSPLEIVGVESIANGFALVRAKFKTQPLNQGMVANELRRRLVTLLASRGITPYTPPAVATAGRPDLSAEARGAEAGGPSPTE
jgi:moderate conductance mechanosensitive channel